MKIKDLPNMPRLIALWSIEPFISFYIFSSWLFAIFSIYIDFYPASSGAVMICGVLLSEFRMKLFWGYETFEKEWAATIHAREQNGSIRITGKGFSTSTLLPGIKGLIRFADKKKEIYYKDEFEEGLNESKEIRWFLAATVVKAQYYYHMILVFTAVVGTAIWGYWDVIVGAANN